jgi:hypothetical protein
MSLVEKCQKLQDYTNNKYDVVAVLMKCISLEDLQEIFSRDINLIHILYIIKILILNVFSNSFHPNKKTARLTSFRP